MRFLPLTAADFVFDACGRLVPPDGMLFVDLYQVMPFFFVQPLTVESGLPPSPTVRHIVNNNRTTFLVLGFDNLGTGIPFNVKWPNGRFLLRQPFTARSVAGWNFPTGQGGTGLAFADEMPIPPGGRVTVNVSGVGGNVAVNFVGVARYMVRADEVSGDAGASACLVGYPIGGGRGAAPVKRYLVDNPLNALKDRPRYGCPAGNILAPEVLLSNQCADMTADSFSFFTDTYTLGPNASSYSNAVIIPGAEDVVLTAWRPITSGAGDAVPTIGIRLPSGYSLTGGDLIPVQDLFRVPIMPRLRVPAGGRLIFDVSNVNGSNPSPDVSLQLQFFGYRLGEKGAAQ